MYTSTPPVSDQLSECYDLEEKCTEHKKLNSSLELHEVENISQIQLILMSVGLVG